MDKPPVNNTLTNRQFLCLKFLSDKMEANSAMVGCHLAQHGYLTKKWNSNVGRVVLGILKRKGLVMRLPELKAWRLTKEGRDYVTTK